MYINIDIVSNLSISSTLLQARSNVRFFSRILERLPTTNFFNITFFFALRRLLLRSSETVDLSF